MQYSKKQLDQYKVSCSVAVDQEQLQKSHQAALKQLGKNVKVAGFRPGHVPLAVLEKSVDQARLFNAEMNEAVNASISELIKREKLRLIDQPQVEVKKYVPTSTLEFDVEAEVVPPIKLADPTKLKVKRPVARIDQAEVDSVIKRLRNSSAERQAVDRPARDGDEVVIDFTGLKDDQEFPGGKAKDYTLVLGSGSFIPGFESGIVGHKTGDKFDVKVTFPKEYGAKGLAGKKAVFKINLKKVHQLTLPELDDKFARSISPDLGTMQALRDDITRELTRQEEASAEQDYHQQLLDKLADKSKIDLPPRLIDERLSVDEKQFVQNLLYRGLDMESYLSQLGKTKEQWRQEDLRSQVEKRLRSSMALRQFIDDNHISVTDEALGRRQAEILSHYTDPQMKAHFETPEAIEQTREQLLTEQALTKLAELNEGKS